MGQVSTPQSPPSLILSAVDRLVASNADGGLSPAASHVILLGQAAGQNDSASNVIGLGFNALGALGTGMADTANLNGSIAIGQNALAGSQTGGTATGLANTAIGRNALAANHVGSANVAIGDGALAGNLADPTQPTFNNVMIGTEAGGNIGTAGIAVQTQRNVVIGASAGRNDAGSTNKGMLNCVIIGDNAATPYFASGSNGLAGCVIIGELAGTSIDENGNGSLDAVVIGRAAGVGLASPDCVMIGAGSACLGPSRAAQIAIGKAAATQSTNAVAVGGTALVASNALGSIAIGASATVNINSDNTVLIGANAASPNGARNIILGAQAGSGEPAANADRFMVETVVTGTRRGVLYGDMSAGNLLVGLSTPAVNRDLPGTNVLKLLNGTATGAAPVGGGFFYSSGGALHWVDTTGNDSQLTGNLNVTAVEPRLIFTETDAAASAKKWDIDVNAGQWALRTRTDVDGAGDDIMRITRNGVHVDGIAGIVIGNTANLEATMTIGFKQVLFQATDETDFTAKLITLNANSGTGSSVNLNSDRNIDIFAGQDGLGTSTITIQNDFGDIAINAGGVDGDIALACTGTGTINCTGQIIQNNAQLARTSVAYTNNAAAQAATLLNGPTAGNPTKWIPINDNGTIRNIPAW